MEALKKSDLEIGDILIFEDFDFSKEKFLKKWGESGSDVAFNYLLHYLIAWFDPGKEGADYRNIYHAGIWGNVDVNRDNGHAARMENCVVQAGTTGIGHASLENSLSHEAVMNIYVCRAKKDFRKDREDQSFQSQMNHSVREFYKIKGKYSYETAWLLAAICSLRYSDGMLQQLLNKHFNPVITHFLVEEILKVINQYSDHHQREMVACSTLVAMMYKNAGYELPINIFQVQNPEELPAAHFDIKEFSPQFPASVGQSSENWSAVEETVVTPRQLMESPEVEVVGVLRHRD